MFAGKTLFCNACLIVLIVMLSLSSTSAQEKCEIQLGIARIKYYSGEIGAAIDLINDCLNQHKFRTAERIMAYELLALSYQAKKNDSQARSAIKQIIAIDEDYIPIPSVLIKSEYIKLVEEVRNELNLDTKNTKYILPQETSKGKERKTKGTSKWPWIAIGAGVTGGIVALLTLGGGGQPDGSFPRPPGRPEGQ